MKVMMMTSLQWPLCRMLPPLAMTTPPVQTQAAATMIQTKRPRVLHLASAHLVRSTLTTTMFSGCSFRFRAPAFRSCCSVQSLFPLSFHTVFVIPHPDGFHQGDVESACSVLVDRNEHWRALHVYMSHDRFPQAAAMLSSAKLLPSSPPPHLSPDLHKLAAAALALDMQPLARHIYVSLGKWRELYSLLVKQKAWGNAAVLARDLDNSLKPTATTLPSLTVLQGSPWYLPPSPIINSFTRPITPRLISGFKLVCRRHPLSASICPSYSKYSKRRLLRPHLLSCRPAPRP
jgi:hypothetical protein